MASPQVWLITGCSSGFGAAFVRALLHRGDRVIATARDLQSLEQLREAGAACLQLDICAAREVLEGKVAEALSIYGHVDVLINNAGYAQLGTIEETSQEAILQQFKTVAFGTMELTRAIIPSFRKQQSGTIVMVTSVDAWVGRAGFGPYAAAKHALQGFSLCLGLELKPFGIHVLRVAPGTFRTSAITRRNLRISPNSISEAKPYADLWKELDSFPNAHGSEPGDPDKLAARVVDWVKLEGEFEGRTRAEVPDDLILGRDAWEEVRENCVKVLEVLDRWKHVSLSTDYD